MNNIVKGIIILLVCSGIVAVLNKYPDESIYAGCLLVIALIGYWLLELENDSSSN